MRADGRPGFFLTLEGGEGAGKSTQARRLADVLRTGAREVVVTREPGGLPATAPIRELLVTGDPGRWSALAEAALMFADRAEHLERLIRPALDRGALVMSDRFADSSRAYQGAAGGVGMAAIGHLSAAIVGSTVPDLTLIFDLPPEAGLARAAARGGEARFEAKGLDYHRRIREAFLDIARAEPGRCVVIDADRSPDAVFADAIGAVHARLPA